MKYIFLLFLAFSSLLATSNETVLNGSEKYVNLTPSVSYYVDETSKLGIQDILHKKLAFKKSNKKQLSFGHKYTEKFWFTFTLCNDTNKTLDYLMEYEYPLITHFRLYDANGTLLGEKGYYNLKTFKEDLGYTLKLSLAAKTLKTYYMEAENPSTSMQFKLSLWNHDNYWAAKNRNWNIVALFAGAMIILILYNLTLFFFTRDGSYIYYVLVTSAMLFHELYASGYIFLYHVVLLSNTTTDVHIIVLISFFFVPMFARSFLQLQNILPKVDTYLKYLPAALTLITVLTIYGVIPTLVNRLLFILITASIVVITYVALFKGIKPARYYAAGWTIVLIIFTVMGLNRIGVLSFDAEELHLTQASLLLEALIFSIGLAARIRYLKEEKERSDAKLIAHQREEKERLEKEVVLRTKELTKTIEIKNMLLKEVHHRVKNNLQIIISLLRLQSDLLNDKNFEEAMQVSEQRIKAMGSVHEMLYASDDITEIDVKEYYLSLVEEARRAYDTYGNIVVHVSTDISLNMELAIYTGLIINELVNNAYKYAFDEKGGEIEISLRLENEEYILQVKDNGKGGELKSKETSLGMLLVKTLVIQQLKGTLVTSTNNGVTHTIIFKKDA